MSGESTEPTFPCKMCGRKFVQSSLSKHEPACKKLTKMQRKVFDSGKQRAANSDVPYKDIKKAAKDKEKHGGVFPRPATHWRERHEDFINAVSASKHVKEALKTGKPLPPPPKSAVHSDYICCVHCGRNFNEKAADRHIAFCKEQTQRKGTSSVATRSSSTGRSGVKNSSDTAATPSTTSSRANRPPSRRSSKERPPTNGGVTIGGAAVGPTGLEMNRLQSRRATDAEKHTTRAGQAPATAHRSNLPTPTKRSNSAPRNPAPPTSHTKNSQTPSMVSSRSSSSIRKPNGINFYQNATSITTAKNTAVNGQSRGGFLSRNGKVPGKL